MKSVNIAQFKAQLSKYLGFVRQGEDLIVLDRKEPLARVSLYKEKGPDELVFEQALEDPKQLFALSPGPINGIDTDSLSFLQTERGER